MTLINIISFFIGLIAPVIICSLLITVIMVMEKYNLNQPLAFLGCITFLCISLLAIGIVAISLGDN